MLYIKAQWGFGGSSDIYTFYLDFQQPEETLHQRIDYLQNRGWFDNQVCIYGAFPLFVSTVDCCCTSLIIFNLIIFRCRVLIGTLDMTGIFPHYSVSCAKR